MNVVFHALVGGAIAHVAFALTARRTQPGIGTLSFAALASFASHGALDWLPHGYPIPSILDVVAALALSGVWLLCVRPPLRLLFAVALASSFLPDVIDQLPPLLHLSSARPRPVFPWHAPRWSGSMYPAARIRPGTHLRALEDGHNALISILNHLLVLTVTVCSVYFGRAAFSERRRTLFDAPHR